MFPKTPISPLRYPGGKARLAPFFAEILTFNGLKGCNFVEVFAGGAGAALGLLTNSIVETITLNDLDENIFSFWNTCLQDPEYIISKLEETNPTIENWNWAKGILDDNVVSEKERAFATLFVNRCSRSGILKGAGPVGGMDQKGPYGIGARYSKLTLMN